MEVSVFSILLAASAAAIVWLVSIIRSLKKRAVEYDIEKIKKDASDHVHDRTLEQLIDENNERHRARRSK